MKRTISKAQAPAAPTGTVEVVLVHRLKIRADFIEPGSRVELDANLAAKLEAQGAVRVIASTSA